MCFLVVFDILWLFYLFVHTSRHFVIVLCFQWIRNAGVTGCGCQIHETSVSFGDERPGVLQKYSFLIILCFQCSSSPKHEAIVLYLGNEREFLTRCATFRNLLEVQERSWAHVPLLKYQQSLLIVKPDAMSMLEDIVSRVLASIWFLYQQKGC